MPAFLRPSALRALFLALALGLGLVATTAFAQSTFVRPGIPFTTADINQLRANLNSEPWASAFASFASATHSQLSYGQQGPHATVGRAPNLNLNQFNNDMLAIHNLTWMWILTSNPAFAQKATDLLDAWAVVNTRWSGDETFLALGDACENFVTAADLLQSTYSGWTAANTAHVNAWFAQVLWPEADVPNPVRGANQGAIQLKLALSLAVFLNDPVKWQQAIDVLRRDAGGGLANSLPNGQLGDTGRDEGHWRGQLAALAWCAEVAWKQGVDVFSELDNRLLAASELYSRYQLDPSGLTYVPFGGSYAYWFGGFGGPGGQRQALHTYNIIENAYVRRLGLAAPHTLQLRGLVAQPFAHLLFRKTADSSTAAPLPPIAHPSALATTSLTRRDIGATGLIGTATYDSGTATWTLEGAGAGIPVPAVTPPDAFHYAFQPVTGDVVLVTRVTSLTTAGAQAGVTMRESLAPDARQVSLLLDPTYGIAATWRGATAWNKSNISWNNPPAGYQSHGGPAIPWWLKLERLGSRLYAFHSHDGANWTCVSTVEIPLPATAYLGLCVTSGDTSARATATFTDVALTPSGPPGSPTFTSSTEVSATAGAPFTYAITATGSPSSYAVADLPAGLSLDAGTGVISGTPTAPGTALVTLHATNAAGTSHALLVLTVTSASAPAAPADLLATDVGGTRVSLSWTAAEHATSYTVRRSLTPGGPYTTIVTGVGATSFLDASPYPGYNYYVVTALAGALESAFSAEAAIQLPPSTPSAAPTITHGDGAVSLTWPAATGAESYNVKRATTPGGPYTTIATGLTSPGYTDAGLTNGTYYYYVVTSVAGALESANSAEELGVPGATTATWSSTAASGTWSTAVNWQSSTVPATPAILGFGASTTTTLNNDLTGLSVARLTFTPEAPAYTISGNALSVGSDLTNLSPSTQVINPPLTLANNLTVNVTAGDVRLGGVLSGPAGLIKRGPRQLILAGAASTYAGGTTIYESTGGWPPNAPLSVEGIGTGAIGAPTSGPLGIGPVVIDGGALMNTGNATLFNDIIIPAGARSFLYNFGGNFRLGGRLLGSGTLTYDGTTTAAVNLTGDNSGFTGTFVFVNRSSNQRLHFNSPSAGSPAAHWVIGSTFTDTPRLAYSGTMSFGAMSGAGAMRSVGGAPGLSVGALNLDTEFSGIMSGDIALTKVGTGTLKLSGSTVNSGPTTVIAGTLLINGTYISAVTATGGTFGGSGTSSGSVTLNSGATLAPGNQGIGTFTTTSALTLTTGAIYAVELNTTATSADKVVAGSVTLGGATLALTDLAPGPIPLGTAFTLIDQSGSAPVSGTFAGLPELALIDLGGQPFRLTYRGGNGNDVVLHDERTTALPTAVAGLTATAIDSQRIDLTWTPAPSTQFVTGYIVKRATTAGGPYTVVATNVAASAFSDAGLAHTTTYTYVVSANNYVGAGPDSAEVSATTLFPTTPPTPSRLLASAGTGRIDLAWSAAYLAETYAVKRALTSGGPYTTLGTVTGTTFADTGLSDGTTYFYVVSAANVAGESPDSTEASATPAPGAHAYWPFNETGGSTAFDLWGGRTATLASNATFVAGASGNGVKLTGATGSAITLPTGIASTLTDFTLSTWVKLDAVANWARLFDFGSSQTNYMFITPRHGNAGNAIRFAIRTPSVAEQQINTSIVAVTGTWMHLAVTRSGNTGILYVNGVEAGRNDAMTLSPASLGSTTLNRIGQSQFNDPFLNGVVDDFRLYGRALSAAEISTMFGAIAPAAPAAVTVSGSPANVVLNWTASPGATSYTLQRGTSAAGPFSTIVSGLTTTSFTDATAFYGPFSYVVIARSGAFESRPSSPATIILPPAPATGLTAGGWNARIDLSWSAATGADAYIVKRALSSEGPFEPIASVTTRAYSDTGLTDGTTYHYIVVATNSAGASSASLPVAATPTADPAAAPWTHSDVGAVGLTGNAGYSSGTYTVHGSGADIWFQADGFHFVHQPLTGDGAIMARVTSQLNSSGIAKAGVMIREALTTNSRHALANRTPNSVAEFLRRTAPNVNSTGASVTGAGLPRWVRLVRTGDNFTAYHSADGLTWTIIGTPQAITMPSSVLAGLAVCAGNNGVLGQATFDHVSLATALPAITSATTASATVGVPFSYAITATQSTTLFTATGLPAGLTLNADTGVISGTPATAGSFAVALTAINALGATATTLDLTVAPGTAMVTLGNLTTTYDGTPQPVTVTTAPAGLTADVTYDGLPAAPIDAGSYAVTATVSDANYIGSATGTLTIAQAPASLALGALTAIYDGTPQAVTITTSPAGLPVAVTYDGSSTAPTDAGSYAVVATIVAANYQGTASDTLVIAKAAASVTLVSLQHTYDGSPKAATATTDPAALPVTLTYDGSATAPTDAGSYAVAATVNHPNYAGAATGTLTIAKAEATITLAPLTQRYDGTARTVVATTTPADLTVTLTYDGTATPPIYPGPHPVVATIEDDNYTGSITDTLLITITALVRHVPSVNGVIDGSVQLISPEDTALNGASTISGDLLVPGTPTVRLYGSPTFAGIKDGPGSASSPAYSVTLNSGAVLRYLVRRVDPLAFPVVTPPATPTGTRNVTLNNPSQTPGNFATLRNLTLNSGAGEVTVPPGTYGAFTANGPAAFKLGVAGATEPAIYQLQALTLNNSSALRLAGPVIIKLANGVVLNGTALAGRSDHPEWLTVQLSSGGVTLNGATLHGSVTAPAGTVTINQPGTLRGRVISDRLTINTNGLLTEDAP